MTKYLPYILSGLLAIAVWQLIVQGQTIKGLEDSAKITHTLLEEKKEENLKLIDSLNNNSQSEVIEAQSKQIDSLLKAFKKRLKNGSYDKSIDKITDVDSISNLFHRVYSNTNKP